MPRPNPTPALHALAIPLTLTLVPLVSASASLSNEIMRLPHLSPLLTYSPASAWTHTVNYSYSTDPGASITYTHWGRAMSLVGSMPAQGLSNQAIPPFEDYGEGEWYTPQPEYANGSDGKAVTYGMINAYGSRLGWRDVRIAAAQNGTEGLGERERLFNVSEVTWVTTMPVDRDWVDSVTDGNFPPSPEVLGRRGSLTIQPTVYASNSTNSFFSSSSSSNSSNSSGWYIAPVPESIRTTASTNTLNQPRVEWYPSTENTNLRREFINSTTLAINSSTSTASSDARGARLTFETVARTSFLQILGSVGPDMAKVQIKLEPQSWTDNLPIRNLSGTQQAGSVGYRYEIDAARPVDATGQVFLAVPIDARVRYNVEITPIWPDAEPEASASDSEGEQGGEGGAVKRIEINGATFATYVTEEDESYTDDWVQQDIERLEYQQGWRSRPGLSGGQIAGIVVGSVLGTLLIAAFLFWCCRRERRKQDAEEAAHGQRKVDDDQQTMTDVSPSSGAGGKV